MGPTTAPTWEVRPEEAARVLFSPQKKNKKRAGCALWGWWFPQCPQKKKKKMREREGAEADSVWCRGTSMLLDMCGRGAVAREGCRPLLRQQKKRELCRATSPTLLLLGASVVEWFTGMLAFVV